MTYLYEWGFTFPNELDIVCPSCTKKALFQYAKTIRVQKKSHIPIFEASAYFDYFYDENNIYWKHYAYYQPAFFGKLEEDKLDTLKAISDSYKPLRLYSNRRFGTYICSHCATRKAHTLDWEQDAYYQTNIRGHLLWAFNKAHLIAIRDFIESNERKEKAHDFVISLYQLPTVFKTHKIREDVLKTIDKLLRI